MIVTRTVSGKVMATESWTGERTTLKDIKVKQAINDKNNHKDNL